MSEGSGLSRRRFLYGGAVTAGSTLLAACSGDGSDTGGSGNPRNARTGANAPGESGRVGSETEPLPASKDITGPSTLAQKERSGDLPPARERVSDDPYVVPHRWIRTGRYGGDLRLGNAPRRENLARGGYVGPANLPVPGMWDPETWYWKHADRRSGS